MKVFLSLGFLGLVYIGAAYLARPKATRQDCADRRERGWCDLS